MLDICDDLFSCTCSCVISTLCSPNLEFQLVNPTTQVALFAFCVGVCENLVDIHWNIYKGDSNSSSNSTQWTLFDRMITYENIWFFGKDVVVVVVVVLCE